MSYLVTATAATGMSATTTAGCGSSMASSAAAVAGVSAASAVAAATAGCRGSATIAASVGCRGSPAVAASVSAVEATAVLSSVDGGGVVEACSAYRSAGERCATGMAVEACIGAVVEASMEAGAEVAIGPVVPEASAVPIATVEALSLIHI